MRQFFSDILIQMKGIWARLEGQQRLVVSAVLLATVVGLGAMVWYAGQPSYETFFTAQNADEMKRAQQALGPLVPSRAFEGRPGEQCHRDGEPDRYATDRFDRQ